MKTLEDIKNTLSEHRKDISEEFRVKDMGVFGSLVRGEAKEVSKDALKPRIGARILKEVVYV